MGGGTGRQWSNCGTGAAVGAGAGAIGGALLAGSGNRTTGAVIGGLIGGLAGCVIADQLREQDKQEITTAEQKALQSGSTTQTTWTNEKGEERSYSVQTEPVQVEAKAGTECKKTTGTLAGPDGKAEGTSEQVYCKSQTGEWETAGAVL